MILRRWAVSRGITLRTARPAFNANQVRLKSELTETDPDRRVNPELFRTPSKTKSFRFPLPDEFNGTNILESVAQGSRKKPVDIPQPLPIVPDVATFLLLIGRSMKQYADKFPSWESLFATTQLPETGISNVRDRRYLRMWVERYRNGMYGPGWNLKHIHDSKAILGVYKLPGKTGKGSRVVVNLPPEKTAHTIEPHEVHIVGAPYRVRSNKQPCGPHARAYKGNQGCIDMWEGLWELKRGTKVDGGERRKAMVRFKKRVVLRRAQREAEAGAL